MRGGSVNELRARIALFGLGVIGGGFAAWVLAHWKSDAIAAAIPHAEAPPKSTASIDGVPDEDLIVFFDLETTIPATDLLEFGAVVLHRTKFVELDRYQTLVYSAKVSERSTACNHITDAMARAAPSFESVAERIFAMLDGKIWAGHNLLGFDCKVIDRQFERFNLQAPKPRGVVDTLPLLRKLYGKRAGDLKLASLGRFFGMGEEQHRSIDDVEMNIDVLKSCAMNIVLEQEYPDLFPKLERKAVKVKAATPAAEKTGPVLEGEAAVIAKALSDAMESGDQVWISYDGGSTPLIPRPINPLRWQRPSVLIKAICGLSHTEKSFSLAKIVAVRDQCWSLEAPATSD